MRLIELLETIRLDEMRVHFNDTHAEYPVVIAFRGHLWVFDPQEASSELINSIAEITGADYPRLDSWPLLVNRIRTERPDIFFGHLDRPKKILYIPKPKMMFPPNPLVSPEIKKIANALGVKHVDWQPSEDQDPLTYEMDEIGHDRPQFGFHGTNLRRMGSILRFGLTPNEDQSNWAVKFPGLVFFTVNPIAASRYAMRATRFSERDHPVMIQFNIPDPDRIVPDYDVSAKMIGKTNQTTNLGYTTAGGDDYTNSLDQTVLKHNPKTKFWKQAGVFGYKGRIPASQFRAIWISEEPGEPIDFHRDRPMSVRSFIYNYFT